MYTKLVRIGSDAEMKYLPSGTAVLELSAVYDVGFGENKKPQWIKMTMFGARAEKLVQHFTKGKLIVATMDDVKSEAWTNKTSGEAQSGMSAKLVEFEFAGGPASSEQQNSKPQQSAPQQQQAPAQQQAPQMAPTYQPQPAPQHAPQKQGATQSAPNHNEPPMDFDDDIIPF